MCDHKKEIHMLVVTKIRNGTERNGMVPPTTVKYGTHGTEQSRNSQVW